MTLTEKIRTLAARPGVTPEAHHLLDLAAQASCGTPLSLHIAMPTPTATPWHPPHAPPDDNTTVLLRIDNDEDPITTGFIENRCYRFEEGGRILSPILGWLHLDEAARLLDTARP